MKHMRFDDLDSTTLEAIRSELIRLEAVYIQLKGIYGDVAIYADDRQHTPSAETISEAEEVAAYIDRHRQACVAQRQRISQVLARRADADCIGGPLNELATALGFDF